MKNLNSILIISCLVYVSCSSDDDSAVTNVVNNDPVNQDTIEYIDQDLQGQVEGEDWTYVDGVASSSQFTGDSLYRTFISIGSEEQDTSGFCSLSNPDDKPYVLFSLRHQSPILETVEKTLSFDFSGETESFTVTLVSYPDSSSIPNNRILSAGKLEILEVDTVEKLVRGRMAVSDELEGNANSVNGNFSIYYCDF